MIEKEEFLKVPLVIETGMIPIMSAMPPFHFWEPAVGDRRIPLHAHELGMFVLAEVTGARSLIYVKGEDGLYDDDPKKNPRAKLIPRIGARELLDAGFADLAIEPAVLENMIVADHVREVQIINGLVHGRLTRALAGEHVGTVIDA